MLPWQHPAIIEGKLPRCLLLGVLMTDLFHGAGSINRPVAAGGGSQSIMSILIKQGGIAKRMLSHKSVWAITVNHWCSGVGNYVGLAWFP